MARGALASHRDRRVIRVLASILVVNAIVAALELAYGWYSGSSAVLADGLHTVLDASNNVMAMFMARIAAAPPDRGHPYGHRKFEVIGSVGIGIMLLLMVWEVGRDAVHGLLGSDPAPTFGPAAYVVMGVTLALNLVVTVIEHRAGRQLKSPLLVADAQHTLADIFVKLGVLAGIMAVQAGIAWADSAIALGVLGFIGWIGYGILRQGLGVLADEAALPVEEIRAVAMAVADVRGCRRARSRGAEGDIRVDLIIEVDPRLVVIDAHAIADRVEDAVHEHWPQVSEVVVHVEPMNVRNRRRTRRPSRPT